MYKKFLILLIILLLIAIYFKFFLATFTGLISQIISLSIANSTQGKFIYFSYPSRVLLGDNATFDVIFQNTGNLNITERIEIHIKNSSLDTIASYYDDNFTLSPLQTRNFSATWTPTKTGTYYVIARDLYNSSLESKILEENRSFSVLEAYKIELSVYTDESAYCPGDIVTITNKLNNTGAYDANCNLSTKVFNSSSSLVHNVTWTNFTVNSGEVSYYQTTYQADGGEQDYNVISNLTYDEKNTSDSTSFTVRSQEWIGSLQVSPGSPIEKTIPRGSSSTQTLSAWLSPGACRDIFISFNKSSGLPGDWVSFSSDQILLQKTGELNSTLVNITIPENATEGDYTGTIYVKTEQGQPSQTILISLIIHVTKPEISVSVKMLTPQVCLGSSAKANVTITTSKALNLSMDYQIINPSFSVVNEKKEDINVNGTLERDISLIVPSSGLTGYYTFLATAIYSTTKEQASDVFKVISCIPAVPGEAPAVAPSKPLVKIAPTYGLELNLSTSVLSILLGNKSTFTAYVKNIGTKEVKGVRISIEGIPSDWITVMPSKSDIVAGKLKEYSITISVPKHALTKTYELKIKATDEVQSNTQTLTLIVGKNYKEIAYLLLKEMNKPANEAKSSLSIEECIDISVIKALYEDAKRAIEKGMLNYNNKNYKKAIDWFEYAFSTYKKVVSKDDILIRMEIETSKKSEFLIPLFYHVEEQFNLAENYLKEKNYERICEPIEKIRGYILYGMIFWPSVTLLIIALFGFILTIHKKRREKEREKILERIKKRKIFEET